MTINQVKEDKTLTLKVAGRLDTTTVNELEDVLNTALEGITDLVFDFSDLEYISSAGLRVLLKTQKQIQKTGTMIVRGANDMVLEIFEVTGFNDILTIE